MQPELAWASGYFEGEGCFTTTRGLWPTSKLETTDEDGVRRFAAAVGIGKVTAHHRYKQHKPTWLWAAHGHEAMQYIACMLWDGLGARRRARVGEILNHYRNNRRIRGRSATGQYISEAA